METVVTDDFMLTGHITDSVFFGTPAFEAPEAGSMPSLIYKYIGLNEFTIRNLLQHKLYFAPTNSYNDPFEGRVQLSLDGTEQEWEPIILEFLNSNNPNIDFDRIDKSLRKEILAHHYENRKNVATALERGARERFGVCCFSEVEPQNGILMFSHYANSHRGICIEFHTSLEDVAFPLFHGIRKVNYVSEFPKLDIAKIGIDPAFATIIHTKSNDWSNEKEWRSVLADKERPINYAAKLLKSITLGANTTKEDELVIRKILKGQDVEIKKAHLDNNSFAIAIENLPKANS